MYCKFLSEFSGSLTGPRREGSVLLDILRRRRFRSRSGAYHELQGRATPAWQQSLLAKLKDLDAGLKASFGVTAVPDGG